MRIAVFGTGGVGGYFGGKLAKSGEQVVFLARGEHLKAMRQNGLRVQSVNGDFVLDPVNATDTAADVGEVDAILVAVKAWQVPDAALAVKPMVGPETIAVPLENGVEAPDQLAAVLGESHVLGGCCKIFSYIAGPGHIRHAGVEPVVAFGELDNTRSERVLRLYDAFVKAGITTEVPPDIHIALWEKFLFIAPISGVGAVTRAPVGVLRAVPETRKLLEDAMREILAIARAKNILISEDLIAKTLAYVDSIPPNGTASMQRDIMEGRPSELEAQSGAVVRLGKQLGISTPVHSFIYHALLPSEHRARGQINW